MASGMDYGLRPGFFKFECRKFDVWFKFELAVRRLSHLTYGFWPGRQLPTHGIPKRLLARTAVADSRVATRSFWLGFDFAVWPGLDFAVGSFSKRVATHSLWPGFDFAVCTFPYRMARVMECFAKIECPILKFHVIIDF